MVALKKSVRKPWSEGATVHTEYNGGWKGTEGINLCGISHARAHRGTKSISESGEFR